MPTSTYIPLANITLASNATSVTFSSISQSYRDLVLIASASLTSGTGNMTLRFNSDSGTNYTGASMEGTGSAAQSGFFSSSQFYININNGSIYTSRGIDIVNIMDYSVTDKHKTVLARGSGLGTGQSVGGNAGRWANTAAITTIQVLAGGATYAAGSTFALYGIAA